MIWRTATAALLLLAAGCGSESSEPAEPLPTSMVIYETSHALRARIAELEFDAEVPFYLQRPRTPLYMQRVGSDKIPIFLQPAVVYGRMVEEQKMKQAWEERWQKTLAEDRKKAEERRRKGERVGERAAEGDSD